jgi:WhiB family transcriptional regulator, redox-sensing transcriptional regulator
MPKQNAVEQAVNVDRLEALRPEPAAYVPSAPENWFVDPVRLGVPGVRQPSTVATESDDNPLAWQSDSLCAQTDPEAFFPEKGGSTRDAKKICASCEVRAQCLEYALENDERFGIWGGLSERERRKLRKRA